MKLVLSLLLFILIGCSTTIQKPVETSTTVNTEEKSVTSTTETTLPEVVVSPSVVEVKTVKLIIVSLQGFNEAQATRFKQVTAKCEQVVNSKDFASAVLNHTWQGKKQFVDTTDSTEKVLEKILSADWKLEYRLEYLSRLSKTIGYTYPNVNWIVINGRKYSALTDADICGNIVHEYGGHKFGRYDHAKTWSESRDYSTPYGLGYIAEKIYRQDK